MSMYYYGLQDTTASYAIIFLNLIPLTTFILSFAFRYNFSISTQKIKSPLILIALITTPAHTRFHGKCIIHSILVLGWRHCESWARQDRSRLQEFWCPSGARWSSAYIGERSCIYGATIFFTITTKSTTLPWMLQAIIGYVEQSCWQAAASCLLAGTWFR